MTMRRAVGCVMVVVLAGLVAGCATGRAFARGESAGLAGDWEAAVGFYRLALQNDPDRPDYKIALERAMLNAANMYAERGGQFEAAGQMDDALRAYRKAQEFEPSNRQLAAKAAEIERLLRDRLEAAAPRPEIELMREQARRSIEPVLSPSNPEPLIVNFVNTGVRDILTFIGNYSGINVTFDSNFQDRSITLRLEGVTLVEALQQIMIANQYFYKVLNDRTIIVAADTMQKRTQYEEQVIRTFFVSHADATELSQLLTGLIRVAGQAIQPQIVANKTANTITIRGTNSVVQIAEKIIQSNDKPRAEVVVEVQILEVSRERAKRYGLSLTDYAIGGIFSPEASPGATSTAPSGVGSPPIQPQHHFLGCQHGGFLFGRAGRGDAVSRKRFADEGAGQAEPARNRRSETVTEPRRGRPGPEHHVHADRHRRLQRQSARVVRVSLDRHHRRHDADARNLRG